MPLFLFCLFITLFTTRLVPNQHQQCIPVLPAAAGAPTQVSSTLTSCCRQMIHLCKLPPVCERSRCTTWRCHVLEWLRRRLAVGKKRCRTMCTSRGVPAADTGTRMAQTDGCSLKDPNTWLTQAACALSRVHGCRELRMHLERDRSDPQDGTPRLRSSPACQTRLQTSHRVAYIAFLVHSVSLNTRKPLAQRSVTPLVERSVESSIKSRHLSSGGWFQALSSSPSILPNAWCGSAPARAPTLVREHTHTTTHARTEVQTTVVLACYA